MYKDLKTDRSFTSRRGKIRKKTDTVSLLIIGGAFTTILTLVGLFNLFIN